MEQSNKQAGRASRRRGPRQLYEKPGAIILTTLIVVIGALIGLFMMQNLGGGQKINKDGYQVVYMATGQNFFGKLQNTGGDYLVLKDPYTAQDVAGRTSAKSQTTLLKVSQQTYGPEDVMSLKSDQVLFWQNLRDGSKVTKAIEDQKQ